MTRRALLAICFCVLAAAASAQAPRTITWDDLIPPGPPIDNPFASLTVDQQVEIEMLATIRAQRARGLVDKDNPLFADGEEIAGKLRTEGLDVDTLVKQFHALQAEVEKRNAEVVQDLDGKTVRLPGYALPLEFDGTAVKEFLLVPYVGACIHVPPPPINQMVLVRLNQSWVPKDLYDPVWVTGRMAVERSTKKLNLVDGSGDVQAGYAIGGSAIEPYKE